MGYMLRFCSAALFATLAAGLHGSPASTQEWVGLASGARGMLAYGFHGTDGATGQGLSFAYQAPNAAILLQHRFLDDFTVIDELRTTEAQASMKLPLSRLSMCLVAGAQWTAYHSDRLESESWSARHPEYKTQRHRIGGPYRVGRSPARTCIADRRGGIRLPAQTE